MELTQHAIANSRPGPNNSFKPNLLRSTKAMAETACHGFGSTTQVGLTQALGVMPRIVATLLAATLVGCATTEYYVPASGAEPREYYSCGIPGGYGIIKLTNDASISVDMSPAVDAFWINIQVALVNGATLEFLSDTVGFSAMDGPSVDLVISPTSGGRLPSLDPTVPLIARTPYRPYVINLQAPPGSYHEVSLRLPTMRVNGQVLPEHHASFVHRERKGVLSCVQ